MSELFDDEAFDSEEINEYKGIRFCPECSHMLHPKDQGGRLAFECITQGCGYEVVVEDTTSKSENLVSRRDLQKENKNIILYPEYALDPTMPRENIECPKCGHNEAVFMITTDNEDSKIILVFICCNPECGQQWSKSPATNK